MGILRRALVPGLIVLLSGGLVVGPAGAAVERAGTPSATTLVFAGPATFSGKVTSAKKQCRKTRSVSVVDHAGKVVGTATSAKSGAWRVQFNPIATGGTFTAKVAKLKVPTATGKITCAATTSAPVTVPPDPRYALTVAKSGDGTGVVTSIPGGIACGSDCSETYDAGAVVHLVADPDAGRVFLGWSGDCAGDSVTCTVTMSKARAVTASFGSDSHQLAVDVVGGGGSVASDPIGIACPSDCAHVFDYNTGVSLVATPASGFSFVGWGGSCSGTGACDVALTHAQSVTATFAPIARELTVTKTGTGTVTASTGAISCGATCSATYDHGTSVTLFAEPGVGHAFSGWSGACSGSAVLCTVSMTEARAVNATFTAVPQQLVVDKAGSGSGSVTSTPAGINCGADCSQTYANGTVVTLTAVGTAGSTFTGWSGEGCAGTGTCQVTVNQARSVTAIFTKPGSRLDVVKDGNGHGSVASTPAGITCGGNCSELFDNDTVVTLTATPDSDSTFAGWAGACTGTGACVVTVDQATSVTATFTLKKYVLEILQSSPMGQIIVDPPVTFCPGDCAALVDAGTVVTLVATEIEGATFNGWSGACTGPGSGTCVVTMDGPRTVYPAYSAKNPLSVSKVGAGSVYSSPAGVSCGAVCGAYFTPGATVTLTPVPGANQIFAGWLGDCDGTGLCQVTMDEARSVAASFLPSEHQLTVVKSGNGDGNVSSSPTGVDCGATCSASFLDDTVVTLTATETGSAAFTGWSGACSGTSNVCQVTMDQARTVTARFDLINVSIVKSGSGSGTVAGGGFNCGNVCSGLWIDAEPEPATVTFTVTPDPGSTFEGWETFPASASSGCGSALSCSVTLFAAETVVVARFVQYHQLSVSAGGSGSGSVSSDPAGISCPVDCNVQLLEGTTVTLTPAPAFGSVFVGWGGACAGTGACQVTMDSTTSVSATFDAGVELAVGVDEGQGQGFVTSSPAGISCGDTCLWYFAPGEIVTLVATPGGGSSFLGWTGDCAGSETTCTVSMDEARRVFASFDR